MSYKTALDIEIEAENEEAAKEILLEITKAILDHQRTISVEGEVHE